MAMRESLLLCVLSASLALPALACGPDFPSTLLADRGARAARSARGQLRCQSVPPGTAAASRPSVVDRGAWLWG